VGGGELEYTAEAVWLDSAEESQALRGLLRAAEEEETSEMAEEPAPAAAAV
jgi:hypothetical protein